MEIRRFFVPPSAVHGDEVSITGEEFEHLSRVLRYKVGYRLTVCPGNGEELDCTLTEISQDGAVAHIDGRRIGESELPYSVTLFQALPKGDKTAYIVQKCTELGAAEIVPFTSARTEETKYNRARMRRVAAEACKQCGRSVLCEVGELTDFTDVLSRAAGFDVAVMPYELEPSGRIGDMKGLDRASKIALIIGSEGGFTPEEAEAARAAGVRTVSLGRRILRCETAGLVALAVINYEKGELGR